jgi:signal transduction histidine kinase
VKAVHFTFHVVSGVAYLWAVVLFPRGRAPLGGSLPRRRARILALVLTAAVALVCWRSSFILHPPFFVAFFGVLMPVLGITAQTLQLRSSPDATSEKQSRLLRVALLPALVLAVVWLAARAASGTGTLGDLSHQLTSVAQASFPAVFAVVPVVLFVAIVRLRLWDIDVLASRTLLLGLLLAVVALVYVGCIGLTGWLFRGSGIAVLLPLVVMASVAEPARQWCRRLCNRLVFGTSLSPREAVRSLLDRFSGDSQADELAELTRVVVQSTRAATAALWLLQGTELLRLATFPDVHDAPSPDPSRVPLPRGSLASCQDALRPATCWPVTFEGTLLGVVAVTTPGGVPLTGTESRLLDDLSRHAGLLVANARLRVDLAAQLDLVSARTAELRRSRQEIVAAADLQRRRLENDIHDGAQQQLVALLIQLGVLQRAAPPAAARQLPGLRDALGATRESLRRLATGGAPEVLVEHGLAGALAEAADVVRRTGLVVDLDCPPIRLADRRIETAVYFCCLEALQNITKHAAATQVHVQVTVTSSGVTFSVTDDGTGFAPDRAPSGSGLGNLSSRLTPLGGQIEVQSAPGHGTVVRGDLPVPESVATGSAALASMSGSHP